MHEISKFVFWTSLILYIATLVFVSYVGVYLTYVAIPIIIVSGLIMKLTKPKNKDVPGLFSTINELGNSAASTLDELNGFLAETNTSLELYNRKQALIRENTQSHRDAITQLKLKKVEPKIELKYADDDESKTKIRDVINLIDKSIQEIEKKILEIEKQCELEVARSATQSRLRI